MIEKFDMGSIEYRYPDAMETMDIVSEMPDCKTMRDQIKAVVRSMSGMVTKVNVKVNGKKISKFDDLLLCPNVSVAAALVNVGNEIYSAMFVSEDKKKA